MTEHEKRMMALIEFTKSASDAEPYGCSIYDEVGTLLVFVTGNKECPINHAEILAIQKCASQYPDLKWNMLTLYTTGEPCCMCASACCWANLKEVVYATDVPFMIKLWNIESPMRAADIMRAHPKIPNLVAGICAEASNQMFVERKEVFARACKERRWL